MKFHEDVIFKNNGQMYGQELMDLMGIEGEIIDICQTEISILDPKMYKPDLVFELKDKIVIIEFQSTYVDINDKKRFRFYTALYDQVTNKSNKSIEVHVLSTVEREMVKCYRINRDARFPIYIHSLKNYDGDKFLNNMKTKIGHGESLNKKELLLLSLLCFTKIEEDIEYAIYDSALTIVSIPDLAEDIGQFVKGVVLMLSDKFVNDDLLNTAIANLVGGNMKIIEDYIQRREQKTIKEITKQVTEQVTEQVKEEKDEQFVISLNEEGLPIFDIARIAKVSEDFVIKTLAK